MAQEWGPNVFSKVLSEVSGLFEPGRDFLRTYFFPVLIWIAGLAAVAIGSQRDAADLVDRFQKLNTVLQIGWIAFGLALVAVVATILSSFSESIFRLYEGYWPRAFDSRRRRRAQRFHEYVDEFEEHLRGGSPTERSSELGLLHLAYERTTYSEFPEPGEPEHYMATRFGNIIKAAERYPGLRYGADAVLIWPRLFPLVPQESQTEFAKASARVDFALTVALLAGSYAVVSYPLMLWRDLPVLWFLAVFLGTAGLSAAAYRSAVAYGLDYADQIRAIFDIHRQKLLRQLDLMTDGEATPGAPLESRNIWAALHAFYYWGECDTSGEGVAHLLPPPRPWPPLDGVMPPAGTSVTGQVGPLSIELTALPTIGPAVDD